MHATGWFRLTASLYPATLSLLQDGERYMNRWAELFNGCRGGGIVIHSAWRLSNVRLGDPEDQDLSFDSLLRSPPSPPDVFVRLSGHALSVTNLVQLVRLRWLTARRVHVYPYLDQSYATWLGSFHQKATCFLHGDEVEVLLGSVDLTPRRRDNEQHRRSSAARRPSHDVGIEIGGHAAVELMQAEIEMWSAASYYRDRVLWPYRTNKTQTPSTALDRLDSLRRPYAGTGNELPNRVQILRTTPRPTRERSWPYAAYAERSTIQAYHDALKRAQKYIYIEDQYFTPNFGDAGSGSWSWFYRLTPMDLLVAALRKGVQLIVLVPGVNPNGPGIRHMRDRAVEGIKKQALSMEIEPPIFAQLHGESERRRWRWRFRSLARGPVRNPVHVHSKVLVCDDEFAIVGSANLNGRSFVNDVELGIAVEGPFAAEIRRSLWTEHTGRSVDDWAEHAVVFRDAVDASDGRLVRYEPTPGVTPPGRYLRWLWRLSEPGRE